MQGGFSCACWDLTSAGQTRMGLPLPLPLSPSPTSHQLGGCCIAPHQGTAPPLVSRQRGRGRGRQPCIPLLCRTGELSLLPTMGATPHM